MSGATGYGGSPGYDDPPTDGLLAGYDATSGERRWQMRTDIAPRHLAAARDRALGGFTRPTA